MTLHDQYPSSASCDCDICRYFCFRPGWWTVDEAKMALETGYADRMMLEIDSARTFGVLAPAFKGNEGFFALDINSANGCTFLGETGCVLFGSPIRPLECRYCHHDRLGTGTQCHTDIGKSWNTSKGKRLIRTWFRLVEKQSTNQAFISSDYSIRGIKRRRGE